MLHIRRPTERVRGPQPAPRPRELTVLLALHALPEDTWTPNAAASALIRSGIDIPYSTLAGILRRLERRGTIQLQRKTRCDGSGQ